MSEIEKAPFNKRAHELREKHKNDHPDYKYTPRRRSNKIEAAAAARAASTVAAAATVRSEKLPRRTKVTTKRPTPAKVIGINSNSSESPNSCNFTNTDLLPRNAMYESVSGVDYATTAQHSINGIYVGHTGANRHNTFKMDTYDGDGYVGIHQFDNNIGQRQESPCSTASSNLSCTTLTPPATPHNTAILGSSSPTKNHLSREQREQNYSPYVTPNMSAANHQRQTSIDQFANKFASNDYFGNYPMQSTHSTFGTHATDIALSSDQLQSFAHNHQMNETYNNYYCDEIPANVMPSYHDFNAATNICPTDEKKFIPELNGGVRHTNDTFSLYNDAYPSYQMH